MNNEQGDEPLDPEKQPSEEQQPVKIVKDQTADNLLDHWCNMQMEMDLSAVRLTGIIATIGHKNKEVDTLVEMIKSGMSIARMEVVKHDEEFLLECIKNIRAALALCNAENDYMKHVAIAIDLGGPMIRTGVLEGGMFADIKLKKGDTIKLSVDIAFAEKGTANCIYVDYEHILQAVDVGSKLYIDNGLIGLTCKGTTSASIVCTVDYGGVLGSRKCVNLPGTVLNLPAVSAKDRAHIRLAMDQDLDMIFASYVRGSEAVMEIKDILAENGKKTLVVAKIQNQQGFDNADEIIHNADAIIVSRNTLGIELPTEKVFLCQKNLIAKCNKMGKPVVVMSQMLNSMERAQIPHRSEVCDVANAIFDGVDCVALSTETSNGRYPANCIQFMDNVCREAEASFNYSIVFENLCKLTLPPIDGVTAIAIAAVEASEKCDAKAIIVVTTSGISAHLISRFRPKCPIIAVSRNIHTCRQMLIFRGIVPLYYDELRELEWINDVDRRVQAAIKYGKANDIFGIGEPVIVVTPWKQGTGFTNTMRIIYVLPYIDSIVY